MHGSSGTATHCRGGGTDYDIALLESEPWVFPKWMVLWSQCALQLFALFAPPPPLPIYLSLLSISLWVVGGYLAYLKGGSMEVWG